MRVSVLGAGPAGLYLGILLGKAGGHEVDVVERNPPDATFGWGVVFSEETLGALRDADYPSYTEITDTFARWDAIDIHHRGELRRCRGHGFSAIARKRLLNILQRRCTELGVELRFDTEVADPAALAERADLLVAADGVHSVARRSREKEFGSTVTPQGGKYVWFGTHRVFDAFRFSFAHTEHGTIQVHAYPFDEHTSTFIVETPEPTWRAAGLDTMSEAESIEFCERLFAADLDGHRLLSNKSVWLDFPLVRNTSWHAGNTVLLGDAAHTAHFTIGSGTKLAMEDAIALAGALGRHADLAAALAEYEQERQPVVERFQQAAADSADYFTRVGSHASYPPARFATNLLTRSGRIGHGNLAQRDPDFVRSADIELASSVHSGRNGRNGRLFAPPPLLVPLRLGTLTVPNRVVTLAGGPGELAACDGAGLVLTGLVAVSPEGRTSPDCPTTDGWADAVATAHEAGALAGMRLGHAGRRGAVRPARFGADLPLPAGQAWPLLSASALPYTPESQCPKEMDADDLARVRTAFADAAATAVGAGFDLLELDCAHGGLLASFLSPLTNRRGDDYGDDPPRFPLEVLAAVRDAAGGRPVAVRLSVTDWAPRGLTADDGVELARAFAAAGADLVHVEAGQTVAESRPVYRRGFLTTLADRVRAEAGVPTLVGGHLTSIDDVNTVVAAGRADLCVLEPIPTGEEA